MIVDRPTREETARRDRENIDQTSKKPDAFSTLDIWRFILLVSYGRLPGKT